MDVKEFITRKFNIYWNKEYDVQWLADKFDLRHYHFKEGEVSRILYTGNKKSISCGVEMTKCDEVFKYFCFTFSQLQELFSNGVISFSM